jgi:hypothetical protein
MAVEMIALAQVEQQAQIYGAVTMGSIWQFGQILAHQQMIPSADDQTRLNAVSST